MQVVLAFITLFNPSEPRNVDEPYPIGVRAFGEFGDIVVAGDEIQIYLSDAGYVSSPSDNPANQNFSPRLKEPFAITAKLFNGSEPSGKSDVSFGNIIIMNGDGKLDNILKYGWDGRDIEIKKGEHTDSLSSFITVFIGTIKTITWNRKEIQLSLRDKQTFFDRPLAVSTYGGTGDYDGSADVEGRPFPLTWGEVKNLEPLLIDPALLMYQYHDDQTNSVDSVYDKRVLLTNEGDVADLSITSVSAASYKTDLVRGAIRLGSSPDGRVTCDVKGHSNGGYLTSTSDIVRDIAVNRGVISLEDPGDLDTTSFTNFETDFGHIIGIHISSKFVNTGVILDELMAGAGGFWYFDRDGKLVVGQLKAPTSPITTLFDKDTSSLLLLTQNNEALPSWKRILMYDQVLSVMGREDVAGSVTDEDVAFVSREFRLVEAFGSGVRAQFRLAREVLVRSFIRTETNAQIEVDRLLALHEVKRDIYQLKLRGKLFELWLSDIVTLQINRFDLSVGKDFIIMSIDENVRTGMTTVELWG